MSTNFTPGLVGAHEKSPNFTPGLVGEHEKYPVLDDDTQKKLWIAVGVLTAFTVYAYLNTLYRVSLNWWSPQYSHGYFIPVIAAFLLWMRREPFRDVPMWQRWVGVGIVLLGVAMRSFGARNVIFFLDNISFVPCIVGLFVVVGGLPTLRWAAPAIVFLGFMYPLPRLLEEKIMHPLQSVATLVSVLLLRTLGIFAYQEGNTINLAERKMGVVEQCSGLRMLTIFAALSFAVALAMRTRPWWERVIIVLSAFPVAVAVNVIRITVIAILYNLNMNTFADEVFHTIGGYIMMPLALGLLFLETQILSRIVLEEEDIGSTWTVGKT